MTTYKMLGVNDDKDFCSCCGKQNLKRVVWLENITTGEVNHYGTNCAAYMLSPSTGQKAKIDNLAIRAVIEIENKVAEKCWGLSPRRAFEDAMAIGLIEAGVDKNFAHIATKTAAFCNYIWPYQRRQQMAI